MICLFTFQLYMGWKFPLLIFRHIFCSTSFFGLVLIQIDNSIFMLSLQPGFCLKMIEDYNIP